MSSPTSSAQGPYRRPTRRGHRLTGLDVGGLAIMVALLGSGMIPVVGAITSGDVASGSAHLGFIVVLSSLLLIVRELRLARGRPDEGAPSSTPPSTETRDD